MIRIRLMLATLVMLPTATLARPPQDVVGAVIDRKLAEGGSWFSPAERRFIADRCGPRGEEHLRIEGDRMFCGDGRVVRDPRVRTIERDVTARASTRVRAAMASPEVDAAVRATADRRVRAALARRRAAPQR